VLDDPKILRTVFAVVLAFWVATLVLFFSDRIAYPYGWLLLPVLAGWAWYKLRQIEGE